MGRCHSADGWISFDAFSICSWRRGGRNWNSLLRPSHKPQPNLSGSFTVPFPGPSFSFRGDFYMRVFRRCRLAAPYRARKLALRLELLEDRTLLSGFAQSLANPGYIIYHPAGSAAPLGTPGPTGTTPT